MIKTFPKLYKKSSKGQIQEWDIFVENSEIVVVHGMQLGKKQTDRKLIKNGKNKGKENETTAEDQAIFESNSKWKKQLDKGYVDSLDAIDDIVYMPMLAQTFSKIQDGKEKGRKKYIKYPCIGQRKFDGVRCLAYINKQGEVILESRRGKRFPHLEHLFSQVKSIVNGRDIIIDGELFSDDIPFQRLVGLVKRETLKDDDVDDMSKINIRLYDCILKKNPDAGFETRYSTINIIVKDIWNDQFENIIMVENFTIKNESEIKKLHDQFVQEGFEGIILRNKTGKYALNKRSNDLQKYKYFQDDEYKIVGFEEGVGRAAGSVIWICEVPETGETFKVRPRGSDAERCDWFENGDKYIDQPLTVRYQEKTDDGKPRFPVGICIRSYE